jgi:hypothetical protein
MPEQFTEFADWTHMQDLTAANEIIQAYNERRQCVDPAFTPVELLTEGDHAQDCTIWREMQEWIEANISQFVNHTIEYIGTTGEIPTTAFTISAFRTVAGIPNGFRRATEYDPEADDWTDYNDPMYSYGTIQTPEESTNDIRGPWVFVDLQKAFDALRWTLKAFIDEYIDVQRKEASGSSDRDTGSIEAAISDAQSEWASASWQSGIGDVWYRASFWASDATEFADYSCSVFRVRSKGFFENIPDHIPHIAEFVVRPDGNNDVDYDSPGEWVSEQILPEETTSERTTNYHDYDAFPQPSSYTIETTHQTQTLLYEDLILKWQFSHTLPEPE